MKTEIDLILANEAALDEDGWALIAPFGEHPKTRLVRRNGALREEKFIQVLDNESADQLLSRENSLFRRLRRALVGIPVYKGHPDLRDYEPETPGAADRKEIIGAIDQVRKTARGLEGHFVLTPAGADAVEKEGCKYPSALWYVMPVARRGDAVLARPFKLLSAGLTAHPNISGVESLANARGAERKERTKEPDMKLITGWLLANGVAVAGGDAPTETQVVEALQKFHTAKAGELTALGNEKAALAGTQAELKSQSTVLENENAALKARVAGERQGRAAAVADLAIARGKATVAERATKIQALENAADFERETSALLGSATKFKTTGNAESGKVLANHGLGSDPREEYCAAVEQHMKESGETDPIKSHHAVMKKDPGLAEKLRVRNENQP
ncbi:MAG: phage protease [Limisphaerales bacterium]